MDKASELGIGSRVKHPDYGLGVVVNVKGIVEINLVHNLPCSY